MNFEDLEKAFDKENSAFGKFESFMVPFIKQMIPRAVSFLLMIGLYFYISAKYGDTRAIVGYLIILLLIIHDISRKLGVLVEKS